MAATITTSGPSIIMAGTGVGAVPATSWDHWIEQAEAYLCNLIKYDAVTNWTSLNGVFRLLFEEYCERYAAMEGIKYDMSGYGTAEGAARIVAEDLINVRIF